MICWLVLRQSEWSLIHLAFRLARSSNSKMSEARWGAGGGGAAGGWGVAHSRADNTAAHCSLLPPDSKELK